MAPLLFLVLLEPDTPDGRLAQHVPDLGDRHLWAAGLQFNDIPNTDRICHAFSPC